MMNLSELLKASGFSIAGAPETRIDGLEYDSRLIKKGDLFFAIPGAHVDGHYFVAEAGRKGAVAAIVERRVDATIPLVVVSSALTAISKIAKVFFKDPSSKLPVIGITGTNGKTTTTYLIENILRSAGMTCGVMGTVNYRIGNDAVAAPNTTPQSLDVQRFLAKLVEKNVSAGVMEVSSHALELKRVDDVAFKVGVFTNLTQDHLDFHKDMDSYFAAKAKLFRGRPETAPVINVDDGYGQRLAQEFPRAITFGYAERATVRATEDVCNLEGLQFKLKLPSGQTHPVKTNLMGPHNISNLLAAAGAMSAFGMPEEKVVAGLNQTHAIPGRLERVEAGQDFVVVVDYAHTHDALAQVLLALRATQPKKLICVFGAGGDRDRTKRPRMGKVAVELADQVIITSDNPRTEVPMNIIRDIEEGIKKTGKENYLVFEDREEAIKQALQSAKSGDIVLIAGKGHETYQIIGDKKIHFSDQETARKYLK